MWLYYFVILLILILGGIIFNSTINKNLNKKLKKSYLIIVNIILILIASLRSEVIGNDTKEYIYLFNQIKYTSIEYYKSRYEIGYLLLNKLISLFTNNAQLLIGVTSIIIIVGYTIFIYKYSNIVWISMYLFITLGYFGASMNSIRIQLAIVVILKSYDYLVNRKKIKFIITIIIAALFHNTAIIFLIAYPISKIKVNMKNLIGFSLLTIVLYIYTNSILNIIFKYSRYSYYINSQYLNGEIRSATIFNIMVNLSIIIFSFYIIKSEKIDLIKNYNIKIQFVFLIVSVCIYIISIKFNLLDRIGNYFEVFGIVLLPNILQKINNKNKFTLWTFIIIILFLIYFSTIQVYKPEWNRIYPYKFFFTN